MGGLLLGVVLLVLPQMYGVGYPVLGKAVGGGYVLGFLLVLLLGKILATSLTIGIGGSGGVFAPSLFVGAMLGAAFGDLARVTLPDAGLAGTYALIGMGAVFAGAARAPITAVVILFELTGEYSIILPMMTAIVLATGLAHRLTPDTIYTSKLRRRGIDLGVRETIADHRRVDVGTVMLDVPRPLTTEQDLNAAARLLEDAEDGVLPVVTTEDGTYVGVMTAPALSAALAQGHCDRLPADALLELPVRVVASDTIETGVQALAASGTAAIPVFAEDGREIVGWFDHAAALSALERLDWSPSEKGAGR